MVQDEIVSCQLRLIETAAKSAKRLGVDMIGMEGFDCAGHPGEEDIGNWVLFLKVRIFS